MYCLEVKVYSIIKETVKSEHKLNNVVISIITNDTLWIKIRNSTTKKSCIDALTVLPLIATKLLQ